MVNSIREPALHFGFHPTHGAQAYAHSSGEPAFGLQLVNHGASEAGDLTNLRKTENLYGRRSSSGLSRHVFDSNVWFR